MLFRPFFKTTALRTGDLSRHLADVDNSNGRQVTQRSEQRSTSWELSDPTLSSSAPLRLSMYLGVVSSSGYSQYADRLSNNHRVLSTVPYKHFQKTVQAFTGKMPSFTTIWDGMVYLDRALGRCSYTHTLLNEEPIIIIDCAA
ncbi:hypothetical protein BDQ17DRAFT_1329629 [Cyathus striatus]|nr:hypothetical protein BDQ17DRAFT_1329629 [Cyathus striatus]